MIMKLGIMVMNEGSSMVPITSTEERVLEAELEQREGVSAHRAEQERQGGRAISAV
jgi:hypothetical protein